MEGEILKLNKGEEYWTENPFKNFSYLSKGQSLQVDGIYIKQLNKDLDFILKDPDVFLNKLIEKLEKVKDDEQATFDILIALRNIIASQFISSINDEVKAEFLKLIPLFLDSNYESENDEI